MGRKIVNTCIVDTYYALSFYLLYCDMGTIRNTRFFVSDTITDAIAKDLPNCVKIDIKGYTSFQWKLFRIKSFFFWWKRRFTKIYAQDHIGIASCLIDIMPYTLIEDAPNVFAFYEKISFLRNVIFSPLQRLKADLFRGPVFQRHMGLNKQCVNRLITKYSECKALDGKKYQLCNLTQLWESSSEEKQKYICRLFNIERNIKCDVVLFTQPFMNDCGLTIDEIMEIYSPYIKKYSKRIVVKPHPRDTFEWKKYFPNVYVMETKAPMQLLDAMGYRFKVAITVCSTAVSSMATDTEILWIGTKINQKIYDKYGDLYLSKK